ncbi:MAG: sensor histidine kinase [Planctomycetota bacterium]|nr:MAG: sensor histidine kinase [Planctomycetota bacterium]
MKTPGRWWWYYGLACAVFAAALFQISRAFLQSERDRLQSQERTEAMQKQRLALWRLESYLMPLLAQETARPISDYEIPPPHSKNKGGEVETSIPVQAPPLFTLQAAPFALFFQWDSSRGFRCPQLDSEDFGWWSRHLPDQESLMHKRSEVFQKLQRNWDSTWVLQQLPALESDQPFNPVFAMNFNRQQQQAMEQTLAQGPEPPSQEGVALSQVDNDSAMRFQNAIQALQPQAQVLNRGAPDPANRGLPIRPSLLTSDTGLVGSLTPLWLPASHSESPLLLLVRKVRQGNLPFLQGIVLDWIFLKQTLLQQIQDLLPNADLNPVTTPGEELSLQSTSLWLATLPVELQPGPAAFESASGIGLPLPLGLTWVAFIIAAGAVGFALHASISFGKRRSQFASTVTHELRTPLTTFRMYTEMLAEGMVREEHRRSEYHRTLQKESDRLCRLVENVLAFARLEEGRNPQARQWLKVEDLIERHLAMLQNRAEEAAMEFQWDHQVAPEVGLHTDPEAVGQILFNLVDNAAKYGLGGKPVILLRTEIKDAYLCLQVRDYGPGVPAEFRRRLFHPFERGPQAQEPAKPGLGLGLSLAKGLARDLGGDLNFLAEAEFGAVFIVKLPLNHSERHP